MNLQLDLGEARMRQSWEWVAKKKAVFALSKKNSFRDFLLWLSSNESGEHP